MLTSISPLGERGRGNKWPVTVAWFAAGSVAAGAAVGSLLGGLGLLAWAAVDQVSGANPGPGTVTHNVTLVVLAAGSAGAVWWDLSGRRLPGRRQVNEDWLTRLRGWAYGTGFGAQLGAAVVTVVNTALVPMFILAALMSGEISSGLVIGATFGLVRGCSVAINARVRDAGDLRRLHRRIDELAGLSRHVSVAAAVAVSGAAVVGLVAG